MAASKTATTAADAPAAPPMMAAALGVCSPISASRAATVMLARVNGAPHGVNDCDGAAAAVAVAMPGMAVTLAVRLRMVVPDSVRD